jgi:hypothetical protein
MKKVVKDFLLESVERDGVISISTYPIGSSIMDYFLEQRGLIEIGLMNAIEDSIETDEEVGGREKPDMVFNEYSRWVEINNMCSSTFSGEVSVVFSLYVVIATNSIIMDLSMTCSWCMSRCCLSTCSTLVKGTVPFKMGRIATFKTLILSTCIISTIGSEMGVIRSSR